LIDDSEDDAVLIVRELGRRGFDISDYSHTVHSLVFHATARVTSG